MPAKRPPKTDADPKPSEQKPDKLIVALDRQIAEAIARRAELIGQATTGASAAEVAALEAKLAAKFPSPLGAIEPHRREALLRELHAACRPNLTALRVAYLGPEDTFSHIAAVHRFGEAGDLAPVATIAAVFAEVETGAAGFGVVPMENSTDGRVTDTLDCFSRSRARICGELPLRIHHQLLGIGQRRQVRRVCSKPQALSQCRNWLAEHLPQAEPIPVASTADAATQAKNDPAIAAIGSRQVGQRLGLYVLAENIEDQPDNITRFAIIGAEPGERTGADKTALMFETPHQPGALADAMAIFKRRGLNLTWIESFPVPGSRGRYLFFVECQGHQTDLRVRRAIEALGKKALLLEVLGSYAQSEPIG